SNARITDGLLLPDTTIPGLLAAVAATVPGSRLGRSGSFWPDSRRRGLESGRRPSAQDPTKTVAPGAAAWSLRGPGTAAAGSSEPPGTPGVASPVPGTMGL